MLADEHKSSSFLKLIIAFAVPMSYRWKKKVALVFCVMYISLYYL